MLSRDTRQVINNQKSKEKLTQSFQTRDLAAFLVIDNQHGSSYVGLEYQYARFTDEGRCTSRKIGAAIFLTLLLQNTLPMVGYILRTQRLRYAQVPLTIFNIHQSYRR